MLKSIKKIPAGTLLVPMLISMILNSLNPNMFKLGGVTEAVFTDKPLNFLIGLCCFSSGIMLDLKTIPKVLKKQGLMAAVKITGSIVVCFAFAKLFGIDGVFGVSYPAFACAVCATNSVLYLAVVEEHGTREDMSAFGLILLLAMPLVTFFVYGVTNGASSLDTSSILTVFVPIVIGAVLGNLDGDIREMFKPTMSIIMPFIGWSVGASISITECLSSLKSGIVLTLFYYLFTFPMLYVFERRVLKTNGICAAAFSSVPGISIGIPYMLGRIYGLDADMTSQASGQLAFVVIATYILSPIIADKIKMSSLRDASH